MSRRPRLDLSGVPVHLVQRGNNRQRCFLDDADRRDFLAVLSDRAQALEVAVHSYALMDNHFHLLATGGEIGAISRTMQACGATYVRHFNDRHGRTGTLWEGRFHSSPIGTDCYLWNCHRYIEMNPVRAGIVLQPADFPWSSFAANAQGKFDRLITPCPAYLSLGRSMSERAAAYRTMFDAELTDSETNSIRSHLRHERPWGSEEFVRSIEQRTGLQARIRPRGRPKATAL